MRRALGRSSERALQALARAASSSSAAAHQQQAVLPAEVAQLVSQRSRLAALPADVEAAVAAAAADANRKAVKRRGQELAYRLRAMSRSKHRGGVHPNLSEQLAAEDGETDGAAEAARRQRRGKRRQARSAALEQLTRAAALPVREASEKPDLRQYWGDLSGLVSAEEAAQAAAEREKVNARSSVADGGSLYDVPAALAYAAARLPACYAALSRALGEVAARRPGWRPSTQLDFGSGPGTAVWAAQHVWREAPLDALAVEPASAMAWLGHEIQQRQRDSWEAAQAAAAAASAPEAAAAAAAAADAQEAAEEEESDSEAPVPPPRLRWMYKLPPQYREIQGRQYDLVTAGYVLGELRGDSERRRLVQQLWERTAAGGVLLLVEPGTPAGAAHIQRARTQLLEAAAGAAAAGGSGASQAHVVAPCPHDGTCPMEGRPSWCHFVQRFQRTQLQRAAKASAGIQPRTYQDERFSYVAIARAARPEAHAPARQPLVAGSWMPSLEDPQDSLHVPDNLAPRKVPADARPLLLYADSDGEEGAEGADEWRQAGEGGEGGEPAPSELEDWWAEQGDDAELAAGYVSGSSSPADDPDGGASVEESQAEDAGALMAAAAGLDEATRRLLLQSIAGEDEEEEDSAALEERLQQVLAAAAAEQQRQAATAAADAAGAQAGGAAPARPIVVLAPVSEATADLLYDGEQVDWAAAEPAAVAAAQAASGAWSRVIRTPRKRSGHVVLDICSAAAEAPAASGDSSSGRGGGSRPSSQQRPQGVLLRQVVSRAAARRDAGGTAPYRLARSLRWGDLWPQHYQQAFRAAEAPLAGGLEE